MDTLIKTENQTPPFYFLRLKYGISVKPNDKCKWLYGYVDKEYADTKLNDLEQAAIDWVITEGFKEGYQQEGILWRVTTDGYSIRGDRLLYSWYWENP